jgi:hypothetical protein
VVVNGGCSTIFWFGEFALEVTALLKHVEGRGYNIVSNVRSSVVGVCTIVRRGWEGSTGAVRGTLLR